MSSLEGAYAVVMLTERTLYAFRDPHGVRPLVLGKLDERRLGRRVRDVRARHRRRRVRARRRARARSSRSCAHGVESEQAVARRERRAVHVRVRLLRAARLREVDCSTLYEARQRMGAALAARRPSRPTS